MKQETGKTNPSLTLRLSIQSDSNGQSSVYTTPLGECYRTEELFEHLIACRYDSLNLVVQSAQWVVVPKELYTDTSSLALLFGAKSVEFDPSTIVTEQLGDFVVAWNYAPQELAEQSTQNPFFPKLTLGHPILSILKHLETLSTPAIAMWRSSSDLFIAVQNSEELLFVDSFRCSEDKFVDDLVKELESRFNLKSPQITILG